MGCHFLADRRPLHTHLLPMGVVLKKCLEDYTEAIEGGAASIRSHPNFFIHGLWGSHEYIPCWSGKGLQSEDPPFSIIPRT